jgi:hypothetical protein
MLRRARPHAKCRLPGIDVTSGDQLSDRSRQRFHVKHAPTRALADAHRDASFERSKKPITLCTDPAEYTPAESLSGLLDRTGDLRDRDKRATAPADPGDQV